MLFLSSVKDAFTNPDSPWYYAVGSAFLLLIIVAVVVFMVVSKKREKSNGASDEKSADGEKPAEEKLTAEEQSAAEEKPNDEKPADESVAEEKPVADGSVAEEKLVVEEQPVAEEKVEAEEKPVEDEQPAAAENPAAEEKPAAQKKSAAKKSTAGQAEKAPAKKGTKKVQKPFVDRLIATASVHGVYNELKNTVLSYPGLKAKLTKDDEQFFFGTDKKAAISLDGETITLALSLERDKVPSQFDTVDGAGDLPTAMTVTESGIDSAQRLIMFAMNVSLLTRNDRHRHTDYVKKAIDAKNRAKKK